MTRTHTYFISDAHLGVDLELTSREREQLLVSFLKSIKTKAKAIFLVGDIFDHWFEYRKVVPKGFVRLLGTLAELSDQGTTITFIRGNHDMWVYDYFEKEIGIKSQREDDLYIIDQKKWYISHGDGLDPSDKSYLLLKKILRNSISQKLYSMIHPRIGLPLMKKSSGHSRDLEEDKVAIRHQKMKRAAMKIQQKHDFDYFICGHLHAPLQEQQDGYTYCNLGDWVNHFTYGVWDGEAFRLKQYTPPTQS